MGVPLSLLVVRQTKEDGMKLSQGALGFVEGYTDAFEDFSDGAWEAATKEAIERICTGKVPNAPAELVGLDPDDVWWAHIEDTFKRGPEPSPPGKNFSNTRGD